MKSRSPNSHSILHPLKKRMQMIYMNTSCTTSTIFITIKMDQANTSPTVLRENMTAIMTLKTQISRTVRSMTIQTRDLHTRAMMKTIVIERRRMKRWLRISTIGTRSLWGAKFLIRSDRWDLRVEMIKRWIWWYLRGSREMMKMETAICIDNGLLNYMTWWF